MSEKWTAWFNAQVKANGGKIPPHLRHATKLTRTGELDMTNRRSKKGKTDDAQG